MHLDLQKELLTTVARRVGFTGNLDFMGHYLPGTQLNFRMIVRIAVSLSAFASGLKEGAFLAGRDHATNHLCIHKSDIPGLKNLKNNTPLEDGAH